MCVCVIGPAAAAVRRCGGDEDVRQGEGQRQPAHLPPQQEVLQEMNQVMLSHYTPISVYISHYIMFLYTSIYNRQNIFTLLSPSIYLTTSCLHIYPHTTERIILFTLFIHRVRHLVFLYIITYQSNKLYSYVIASLHFKAGLGLNCFLYTPNSVFISHYNICVCAPLYGPE